MEDKYKKDLTPEERHVICEKGTEPAFSGKYYKNKEKGMYFCRACGEELFSSETKYDSGTGWPSFWAPVENGNVKTQEDKSHGMNRTEITCSRCGAHLGHVFDDGPTSLPESYEGQAPQPTGKRFCVNSLSLKFRKEK